MSQIRIATIVGSLRADSVNRRLAEKLSAKAPEGVSIEIVDGLADVPFYNEDLDGDSAPEAATLLRKQVATADRLLVVTPEYNGTLPAVVSNAIDWLSRPYGQGAIVGKPFAVVGTTPTPYGGKWAHAEAQRSAGIAGAKVVEELVHSQPGVEVDVLNDEAVLAQLLEVVDKLAAQEA